MSSDTSSVVSVFSMSGAISKSSFNAWSASALDAWAASSFFLVCSLCWVRRSRSASSFFLLASLISSEENPTGGGFWCIACQPRHRESYPWRLSSLVCYEWSWKLVRFRLRCLEAENFELLLFRNCLFVTTYTTVLVLPAPRPEDVVWWAWRPSSPEEESRPGPIRRLLLFFYSAAAGTVLSRYAKVANQM